MLGVDVGRMKEQGRLASIDALRGVAALGVVVFHAALFHAGHRETFLGTDQTPHWLGSLLGLPISFGYIGVFLFFVISGFCIHLRWAKAALSGDTPQLLFVNFWKRRIRRLYPPYIIALVIYVGVAAALHELPPFSFLWKDLALHLVMLHNVTFATSYSLNGVFWTLAIEEQLYLAYFLLIPLRQRLGWGKTLIVCLGARFGWFAFCFVVKRALHQELPVTEAAASHWFTWALGALAVEAAVGLTQLPRWCRDVRLGGGVLLATAVLALASRVVSPEGMVGKALWLVIDPLWGIGFFVLVNWIVAHEQRWRAAGRIPAAVQSLAALGFFSYSLYLTHELLVVYLAHLMAQHFGFSENIQKLLALLILAPLSIVFARVFFQFCELPFIPTSRAPVVAVTPRHPELRPLDESLEVASPEPA